MENENIIEPLTVSDNMLPEYNGWNDQVLGLFEIVIRDIPSDYGYVAFEDSGAYYLVYGSQYSIQDYNIYFGNDCTISRVEKMEDHFEYAKISLSEFQVSVDQGELVYTNLLSGYPNMKQEGFNYNLLIGVTLIIGCFFTILNRNSRR